MLPKEVLVICKIDIVKYLPNRPVLQRRLMRWAIKLYVFALNYVPLRVVKGQALVDFPIKHSSIEVNDPLSSVSYKVIQKALKYILLSDELYKLSVERLLLK